MPKIDPSQLLDCLDSLLGSDGGIKGETEVKRLAVLMTKFSKKLVSKCIYILILQNTEPDLLAKFMAEGGWALIFQWLDEGICNNNHALICEILELLLRCPISLERLKENNCPKVVKGLSKDSDSEDVKRLAGKLVEQWLKFIKSGQAAISDVAMAAIPTPSVTKAAITVLPSNITVVSAVTLNSSSTTDVKKPSSLTRKPSATGIQIVRDVSSSEEDEVPPIGSLPLYKITVRDGKSVLAKVGTKTLPLAVTKKTESDVEASNTVSSVVLKSDPISKKFRYITKTVCDKEKLDAGELMHDESVIREKGDVQKSFAGTHCEISSRQKVMIPNCEKSEIRKIDENDSLIKDKEKLLEVKSKYFSSKSEKDGKSKESHNKFAKISKDYDNYKSESKSKDKERKFNQDLLKDKKKSEHKSHKTDKNRDKDRDRDKDRSKSKDKDYLKERHKDSDKSKPKDKNSKEKEGKSTEKVLSAAEKAQIQADKDKDTLERLKTPAISLLGKIPKKPSSQNTSALKPVSNNPLGRSSESAETSEKNNVTAGDVKKLQEGRPFKTRPKTVKTFHSKFRSTGLEEEIKPPPPRSSIKKKTDEKRPFKSDVAPKSSVSPPKDGQPLEKKTKLSDVTLDFKKDKILEKPGGIKLIPPKPKPALLESDMFSDALTASTKFEPRKRKRRTSSSRDGTDIKKDKKEECVGAIIPDVTSPKDIKPDLKFYRDTLEDDEDKNKENTAEVKPEPKPESNDENLAKNNSSRDSEDDCKSGSKLYPNGVLVSKARRGPKKSVKWKEDSELTSIRLFELDETERVNVTRTFVDMKLMERSHEREAFQLARKLASEDTMEERIPWGPIYEVDVPPDRRSTVEPGKSSLEKNVQYAREKTVLQAIYFHRSSIPDSPAEPDPEVHPTTDPKIIPLDDITGNSDSVSNFQNIPWPEPKPALVPPSPPQVHQMAPQHQQHPHPHQSSHPPGFTGGYSTVASFPGYPQMAMPAIMPPGQGNWRGGDGKDIMNMPFAANGPMCPQMGQPPNMFNHSGPENFPMNGPGMGGFNPGYPMNCDPNIYGPPVGPMAPMGGPPPPGQWNRGGGGWQGGRPFIGPMNMQPKFQKGVCHHFAKFGNCARGSSCRFMHPN